MFPRLIGRLFCKNRPLTSKYSKILNVTVKTCPTVYKSFSQFSYFLTVNRNIENTRSFSESSENHVDALKFEEVCEETLQSLCEYFEDLVENCSHLKGSDVIYGDGVLTVIFGEPFGTYVINRQTPNRQIWLSSPTSGPKRYDFVTKDTGYWVYKHDGVTLHELLQTEINKIVNNKADFSKCSYSLR